MPARTPRHSFTKPSSMPKRMTFKEDYGSEWQKLRAIVIREEPLCRHCQERGHITEAREVDHITPLALGGKHERSNCQPLCRSCHHAKTTEDMKRMPR